MSTAHLKTTTLTEITPKFIKEWEMLWMQNKTDSFVNSPNWFLSIIETFTYTDYRIIAIYKGKILVAVAPLIQTSLYGVRTYALPPGDYGCGHSYLIDQNDSRVSKALISALLEQGCVIFENTPEATVTSLRESTDKMTHCVTSPNYLYDIQTDKQGEVVFEKHAKFLYKIRNLQDQFTLKTFKGTDTVGFDIVFSIDAHSRKRERGYNAFANPTIQKFYRTLGAHFRDQLLVHVLFFESTPIAYEIGFCIGTTYVGSQFAFDGTYKQYAPGKVLIALLIQSLGKSGIRILNCGSGDSHIKRSFSSRATTLSTVILSKNTSLRMYFECIQSIKTTIFSFFQQQPQIYSVYKTIQHRVGLSV